MKVHITIVPTRPYKRQCPLCGQDVQDRDDLISHFGEECPAVDQWWEYSGMLPVTVDIPCNGC